jgi:WD40 repeat protein
MRLWDPDTGSEMRRFRFADHVTSIAFSADGQLAVVGAYGTSRPVSFWNLQTSKELAAFKGHLVGVQSVAISPDGRRALSGSHDHTLRLWELPGPPRAGTDREP